jgi:hypothetical protein
MGSIAQIRLWAGHPFPRTELSCGLCDGRAERGDAVEHSDTDLELGDLTIELACGQALAEQLDAVHLGLGPASAVIAAPWSPRWFDRHALMCAGFRCVRQPRRCRVSTVWHSCGVDVGGGTSGGVGVMTLAGIEGAIGGDGGDLLFERDLVEQFVAGQVIQSVRRHPDLRGVALA